MSNTRFKNEFGFTSIKPSKVGFSVFTTEEIKNLSVLKIVKPMTFDNLGHPIAFGLYDTRMGAVRERGDPCATCYQNSYNCPGHFGHIELVMPCVNMLFNRVIGTLLKISCLNCYLIQLPDHVKRTFIMQIRLLENDFVTEALEIANKFDNLVEKYVNIESIPENEELPTAEFEKLLEEVQNDPNFRVRPTRNTEVLHNEIVNNFIKSVKTRKACMFCHKVLGRIQSLKNRIISTDNRLKTDSAGLETSHKVQESKIVTPEELRRHLRELWKTEKDLLGALAPVLMEVSCEHPTDAFFFEAILVPPPNLRPVNFVDDRLAENPQTDIYKEILINNLALQTIIRVVQTGDASKLPKEVKNVFDLARGTSAVEKMNHAWDALQENINSVLDREQSQKVKGKGLKQVIEKKQGIIRMHMMGKRVNYSARSVITPDPNLNIEEVGVPEVFAKHLTYPVPVTPWNVVELRKLVLNGPNVHPGAVKIKFENGRVVRLDPDDYVQRESIMKRLLTPGPEMHFTGLKVLYRHLQNGDILLLNRQPTLHKPSIMAHTARVLKNEMTVRLHYANCKAYNADFDGDEMNVHFPQDEVARSEAYNLVHVYNQYLVPKDGSPLCGLIQDHMIAGVKMTLRGRFFSRYDYQQLVYHGLSGDANEIFLEPPAIIKPRPIWSGKQILSTIIKNILPKTKTSIKLKGTSKIPAKAWISGKPREWKAGGSPLLDNDMSEAEVVLRGGELLVGVLDKMHYGATPYGLVHCIYELYGGRYATKLLSAFTKTFTRFLKVEGFTLGVHDILVTRKADKRRRKIIKKARGVGKNAICAALDISEDLPGSEIALKVEEVSATNPNLKTIIDRNYKAVLDPFTNDINKCCLPAGLISKFPQNNLQLMVQSGAKGSTVNTMQISCMLGQIELEGKRPPLMISGKSLPSFTNSDFSPRAGGFIDGRFMTGIRQQEFFFHCMAGREGLIDTAVKTSRSGYLQRCLVKHLEGLTVRYDLTVRDSDDCVIQFLYGEDGMDVSKVQFLKKEQLPLLAENARAIIDKDVLKDLKENAEEVEEYLNRVRQWKKENQNSKNGRPDPPNAVFQPDCHFGALNERLLDLMDNYGPFAKRKHKRQFEDMFKLKAMQSLAAPGEPVGLLAAQSIGEPSTQMTLNTFHFAGRGDMNVTLGIPRLREILMAATKNIKTPSMEIPFLDVPDVESRSENLKKKLTRVVVADILEKIDVTYKLDVSERQESFKLRFHFLPHHLYKDRYNVKKRGAIKHMSRKFFGEMFNAIRKYSKVNTNLVVIKDDKKEEKKKDEDEENAPEQDSSDEEPEDTEDAKQMSKFTEKHDEGESADEAEADLLSDDEDMPKEENSEEELDSEEESVVKSYRFAQNYKYDKKDHLWCEISFGIPISMKKIDLTFLLKDVASKSVVWETPNIKRAFTYRKDDKLYLRTDGININEMFKYNELLDLNKLYSNDIHHVAQTYGIEAAMRVIVKEVKEVFNVYGIVVDPRHLSLIADYMTFNGSFEPLNRKGMESSVSPMQQMSFETPLGFLKNAVVRGKKDLLETPSSSLMVGSGCKIGTGAFDLMFILPNMKSE